MLCCYRGAEKTKLLITVQKQKVVEKEADTERKKAVVGESPHNLSPPPPYCIMLYMLVHVYVCCLSGE